MLRRLLPFACSLVLAACGFHLRGMGESTPLAFASLHIGGNAVQLAEVLQRQLSLRKELKLLPASDAEAVLLVEQEQVNKQILTLNRSGRATEYQLVYRATLSVRQGQFQRIAPTELVLQRDFTFDENNVLGKEAEEQLLVRDMRIDAAQQIIRRLSALKPVAGVMSQLPAEK